jgi:predicted nucleic acid-binding Zn ribbon protein
MAKRLGNDSPIGSILSEIIDRNNLQSGLDEVDVKAAWFSLMGNGVATYTRELQVKNKTLYVVLSSGVLREELHHGRDKIIALINEECKREVSTKVILR